MPNSLFYVNPPPKLPLAMISWIANPPIKDTFTTETTQGAAINFIPGAMELLAQAAQSSEEAIAYFSPLSMYYDLTFDKQRELKVDLDITITNPELTEYQLGWHPLFTPIGAYLSLQDSTLYFATQDQHGTQLTYIKSYEQGSSVFETLRIHIKHYPETRTEIWLNDIEAYNNTQHLPKGPIPPNPQFYARAYATSDDNNDGSIRLLIKYIELYQART